MAECERERERERVLYVKRSKISPTRTVLDVMLKLSGSPVKMRELAKQALVLVHFEVYP